MAVINPFCAYRPKQGMEGVKAALPYDVYNREEATLEVKKHPESFLSIDRAETGFDISVDTYAEVVYERARDLLQEEIQKGNYLKDEKKGYYIYELVMDGRSQKGIVACASIDDYQNNVIKKHENTRADKELDRIRHVDTCNMQTGPIFLSYKPQPELKKIIDMITANPPWYEFSGEDGVIHRGWNIFEEDIIQRIKCIFEGMDSIYIADGHHRCASAVKVGMKRREANPGYTGEEEYNYFLSVLFSADELQIMDYNRVVKDLNHMTSSEFMEQLKEKFIIEEIQPAIREGDHREKELKEKAAPRKKGEISMYLDKKWFRLTAKENICNEDPVEGLDVSVLQNHVLQPLFGIDDPKTDKRIDFVGGIRGLSELERRCEKDCKVAFAMYPTSIYELFSVADQGRLMPPKSTWFEPKLRSGLYLHGLEG